MKKKTKKKQKEVSNEDLARMVVDGLEDVDRRLSDYMAESFRELKQSLSRNMDTGFNTILGELGKIADRLDKVFDKVGDHEIRIKKLERADPLVSRRKTRT